MMLLMNWYGIQDGGTLTFVLHVVDLGVRVPGDECGRVSFDDRGEADIN